MYTIKLPSPTSKSNVTNLATVNIINWGGETDGRNGSAGTFASIRSTNEKIENIRIEPVPDIGEEAFAKITRSQITVYVRKVDLIYTVNLDIYSPQSQPNALALGAQVAK